MPAWLTDLDARLTDRLNATGGRQPLSRRLRVHNAQAVSHAADHSLVRFEWAFDPPATALYHPPGPGMAAVAADRIYLLDSDQAFGAYVTGMGVRFAPALKQHLIIGLAGAVHGWTPYKQLVTTRAELRAAAASLAPFFERQLGRRRLTPTFRQVRRAVGVSVWMYHLAQTDQLVCWSAVQSRADPAQVVVVREAEILTRGVA